MRPAHILRELGKRLFRDTGATGEVLRMQVLLNQQLRLRHAAGWVVESCGGTVWITQEGDARDVLLNTGERFTLDRDGKTIVSGIGEAILSVRPPEGQSPASWR